LKKQKVFIVGAGGMVGATIAYALAVTETVSDIRLIDIAEELVAGQATDISHATSYARDVRVRVGDYSEIETDDIVIIASGAAQKPGQSRLDLLTINAGIMRDVVQKVMAGGKEVFILVVANPVDVLTRVALTESGLPKNRVFGSGTTLDTARLRVALADKLAVSPTAIQAYILGEHGDSSFPAVSGATVGGLPLSSFAEDGIDFDSIGGEVRTVVYKIIDAKKSTYYGIGQVVAKIVEAMQQERGSIFSVCSLIEGEYGLENVVIGLPSVVSSKGVQIIDDYPLSDTEMRNLKDSAAIVSQSYASV
jgi:L-lactate dehydrogenase